MTRDTLFKDARGIKSEGRILLRDLADKAYERRDFKFAWELRALFWASYAREALYRGNAKQAWRDLAFARQCLKWSNG